MRYRAKIVKVGDSKGVLIPSFIMKLMGWRMGDIVDMELSKTDSSPDKEFIVEEPRHKNIIQKIEEPTEKPTTIPDTINEELSPLQRALRGDVKKVYKPTKY